MAAVCCVGVSFDFAMVVLSCGGGDGGVCLCTTRQLTQLCVTIPIPVDTKGVNQN